MMGKIGALRAPSTRPDVVAEATQLAVGLVAGWGKKERDKITALLEELRETSEANQKVYDEAVAATKKAETAARAAHSDRQAAEAAIAETQALSAKAATEAEQARSEIAAQRSALSQDAREQTQAIDTRLQAVTQREASCKALEGKIARDRAELDARERGVAQRENGVLVRERHAESVVSELRGVLAKL
jgi:flagellar biosynthesis GTPase FlhF